MSRKIFEDNLEIYLELRDSFIELEMFIYQDEKFVYC